MRVPGDMIFSLGALSIAWFVLRLWVAPKRATEELPEGSESAKVDRLRGCYRRPHSAGSITRP